MADDAGNVIIQATGEIYAAVVGTTFPTSAISAPAAAFLAGMAGYIGEDGVTQSIATDVTKVKAWQNGDVVATVQTSHELTYAFPFLEMNDVTMPLYYGGTDGAAETTLQKFSITGDVLGHKAWLIDVVNGLQKVRIHIPDGQITERGDTSYVNSAATVLPVTITCYPVSGVKAYKYVDHDITSSS